MNLIRAVPRTRRVHKQYVTSVLLYLRVIFWGNSWLHKLFSHLGCEYSFLPIYINEARLSDS